MARHYLDARAAAVGTGLSLAEKVNLIWRLARGLLRRFEASRAKRLAFIPIQ
jgi:hypothetical protein